jgi:hypothetical protein
MTNRETSLRRTTWACGPPTTHLAGALTAPTAQPRPPVLHAGRRLG